MGIDEAENAGASHTQKEEVQTEESNEAQKGGFSKSKKARVTQNETANDKQKRERVSKDRPCRNKNNKENYVTETTSNKKAKDKKQLECMFCSKLFSRKAYLDKHMEFHNKTYVSCDICKVLDILTKPAQLKLDKLQCD